MRAIVFDQHGGTEVLQRREVPIPQVRADEVLLRIHAIGVNYNDVWARRGMPGMDVIMPHISGSDAAGIVEAIGSEVETVKIGDRVLVNGSFSCRSCAECMRGNPFHCPSYRIWGFQTGPLQGAQAEYACVPAANVVAAPENLSWTDAASLPLVLVTTWRMLTVRARISPGDYVLVWGGAGGLGAMAIQICRLFGAHPIAVANTDEKLDFCRSLGASYLINRARQRVVREVQKITERRGVDLVFEHVGEATWEASINALKWGGSIVVCGATTGFVAKVDLRYLWNKQQMYIGSHYGTVAELSDAMAFVQRGLIKPVVMEVLPLEDVARTHEKLERGEVMGKLVLVP
jgi:alcohol dehydrogenase